MPVVVAKNGIVPIPAELWEWLGLGKESNVEITPGPDHSLMMRPSYSIKETAGILPKPSRPVTIEEMNEAIASCSEE